MNFDDIKSAWDNESGNEMDIPESVKRLKRAEHPIDQLKRNIRNEWYLQLTAIIFLGAIPLLFRINENLYFMYYILYVLMIAISAYYFIKFNGFYKRLGNTNLSSKDNLYELYYELKLNMEMYKSFTFVLTPFALMIFGLYYISQNNLAKLLIQDNINIRIIPLLIASIFVLGIIVAGTHWWVEHFYGKYARQIKQLLDELKEE